MKSSKLQKGFTLIELLVVMVIIGSIMTIVAGIVTSVLRGTNKTNVINKVRENGNYAIFQMARTVRYAKSFEGGSVDGNPPWSCQLMPLPLTPTPTLVRYKAVRTTAFDGMMTTFSCNDSADTPRETIASNSESLIDTTSVALPTPISTFCFFTCRQERIADSPTVEINFTLTSKTTSTFVETQASIPFTISIKGRN